MLPLNPRAAALLALLLLPSAVMAQHLTWTLTSVPTPGETTARVVMDEVSELTFRVTNVSKNSNGTDKNDRFITDVTFALPAGYVLLEGVAPSGWSVSAFDMSSRRIAFTLPGTCPAASFGLQQGASALFSLRVIPPAVSGATADVANQQLVAGGTINNPQTSAMDRCAGDYEDRGSSGATWVSSLLSTGLTAQPRVLGMQGDTLGSIVVENRATGTSTANGVAVQGPTSGTGGATYQVVSQLPATLNIAAGNAGLQSARLRATSEGNSALEVRAASGTLLVSPLAKSQVVDVGPLAAMVEVDTLQALSGDEVQVRLTVANTSSTNTYLDVRPRTPVVTGTAGAAFLSGPTPASVARLSPNTSAHFVWRYRVTGAERADFAFQGQADATLNGVAASTRAVDSARGSVVLHRVRISPNALGASPTSRTVVYTVRNQDTVPILSVKLLPPAANFFIGAQAGTAPAGWSTAGSATSGITWSSAQGIPPGEERSFPVLYASIGAVSAPTEFRHRLELTTGPRTPPNTMRAPIYRIEAPVTLLGGNAPEVERLTAVARDGSVTLTWDNPAVHGGVLVLRAAGAAPSAAPEPGRSYAVGEAVGNAQVVYTDTFSSVSSFTDTTVTNGTTYYYRVFNADDARWYSAGLRPTSSGLIATPRARVSGAPLWCYSVGLDARIQPITDPGVGIFSSFNNTVVASATSPTNPSQDGAERWRPLVLGSAAIGSRFPVVPLHGLSGRYLLTADQNGVAYAVNAATGTLLWRWDNNGQPVGMIQSFAVTQLHDFANTAYRAAHPNRDLVFFATRLSDPTLNRVVALNAATGAVVWTYAPGNLGMVSGGMTVDYENNRLYVGSRTHAGSLDSLRILNSLNGTEVRRHALGDIEHSVVRNAVGRQFYVTGSDGRVHAIDQTSMDLAWSVSVASRPSGGGPAFTSFVFPLGSGFVASTAAGTVEVREVPSGSPAGSAPTSPWSVPIPGPSGVFTLNRSGVVYLFVGSSDGRVHQIDVATRTATRQVSIGGAQRIGTPTIDSGVSRLHVGSEDGRICAFPVPFQ